MTSKLRRLAAFGGGVENDATRLHEVMSYMPAMSPGYKILLGSSRAAHATL
jgi:hypothetical protein